jgi:hypothetical protein
MRPALVALVAFYLELGTYIAWAFDLCDWVGATRVLLVAAALFLEAEHQGWTDGF